MNAVAEFKSSTSNLVNIDDYAMSIQNVLGQVQLIQQVMTTVMKEDEHYGKIPGTNKPTLYKSGAEKLCMVFRLSQEYEFIQTVREMLFIAYTVKCSLVHIPTGLVVASGIGSCNSREKKYRYVYIEEITDKPVPKAYWDARNAGNNKECKRILGEGFKAVKDNGVWMIAKAEKVENDNPFDLDNTITKMACKRALVAATLNATAASDIFSQDLEDITRKHEEYTPEPEQTLKEKLKSKTNGTQNPLHNTKEWKVWADLRDNFTDIAGTWPDPKSTEECIQATQQLNQAIDEQNA